ncbi:MAG: hypothetical protein WBF53_03475 [Litorimonas sp.]
MTRQTVATLIFSGAAAALLLGGCSTLNFNDAEPEKYAGFDCKELAVLAESFRPETQEQIFADVSDLERRNEGTRDLGTTTRRARPYEIEQARERRSIALARREKGCI